MAANSIQNLGENQYVNTQSIKPLQAEQAVVEQQNQKAAETDLNQQAANRVQEAFKLNISKEGAAMLEASEKTNNEKVQNRETIEPESPKPIQTPYVEQENRQIVNIVA